MSERTFYERVETFRSFHYIRLKSGRRITFWDALKAADRAETDLVRAFSRAFKLASAVGGEDGDWDLERVQWFVEGVQRWCEAALETIAEKRGVRSQEERIALLRNTSGRTPEEAEMFKRKADELEARLHV